MSSKGLRGAEQRWDGNNTTSESESFSLVGRKNLKKVKRKKRKRKEKKELSEYLRKEKI